MFSNSILYISDNDHSSLYFQVKIRVIRVVKVLASVLFTRKDPQKGISSEEVALSDRGLN